MRVVVAPDSFKGALTALEASQAIERGIRRVVADAEVLHYPMADGGEGTLDALLARGGTRLTLTVRGADGRERQAAAGVLPGGTGVIETAEIAGITDSAAMQIPVAQRATLGMGDAVRALLDRGCATILIGLGGSSTNDGGAGMLAALGAEFFDRNGGSVEPIPEKLHAVARINADKLDARLRGCTLIALSDVDNPLNGPHGATYTFGPQKGVMPEQMKTLDAALAHYAACAETAFHIDAREKAGSGAAGGLGFAVQLLGGELRSGAQTIAERMGLGAACESADLVVTGEGRSDEQTLHGKAPFLVSELARAQGVPVMLLSGAIAEDALPALRKHFAGCYAAMQPGMTVQQAMAAGAELLANSAERMMRAFIADSQTKT